MGIADDFGFGHAGNTAEAGDRGRLNAEEIDENGIVAAEVLVGQIKKGRIAFAQVFDDGAQAFCAADQENIVVRWRPFRICSSRACFFGANTCWSAAHPD